MTDLNVNGEYLETLVDSMARRLQAEGETGAGLKRARGHKLMFSPLFPC
jgi:hypothetical protein